ncbi:MAG: extensin family protein, partial [Beijerinckiaceae bacterium]
SAHGRGLAVDIASVTLSERRVISVETPKDDAERRYIAALRKAGCGWFTTILGPGADPAHANHLHFDLERRSNANTRLCQ